MGLFRKKTNPFYLVLDIGTEALKGLVFQRKEGKTAVLASSSYYLDQFGVWDSRDFKADVVKKGINIVCQDLGKSGVKYDMAVVQLPADVLKSRVIYHKFSRRNPKEAIGKREAKEVYDRVLRETKKNYSLFYSKETGILPQDIQIINSENIEIKIDGYRVPGLLGYEGKTLEFKFLLTFSLRDNFKKYKKIIDDLDLRSVSITHQSQNLQQIAKEHPDCILIDIGGEITQIFLIREEKLEIAEDFNIGGADFTSALSQSLGLQKERARSLKERYSKGELSESVRERIKEHLERITEEWLFELKSKIANRKILFPPNIFLFGGGSLLPDISETLEKAKWENTSFIESPKVELIRQKDLKFVEPGKMHDVNYTSALFLTEYLK